MRVTTDEQSMRRTAGHVEELKRLELVAALTGVESVGQDDGADFEATCLVLAIRRPMPVLGLAGKRFCPHEVGDITKGLWNAPRVLRLQVVVVIAHRDVACGLLAKRITQRAHERRCVSVLVKQRVVMLVWMDTRGRRLEDVAEVNKVCDVADVIKRLQ